VLAKDIVEGLRRDHLALVVEDDLTSTLDPLGFACLVALTLAFRVDR
jgi:hypothetical protein